MNSSLGHFQLVKDKKIVDEKLSEVSATLTEEEEKSKGLMKLKARHESSIGELEEKIRKDEKVRWVAMVTKMMMMMMVMMMIMMMMLMMTGVADNDDVENNDDDDDGVDDGGDVDDDGGEYDNGDVDDGDEHRHLRTRRALLLYKVYGNNTLLALNWRHNVGAQ